MKSKSGGEKQPGGNLTRGKKTAKGNELKPLSKDRRPPAPACASCGRPISDRICFSEKGGGSKGCPTLAQKSVLEEANREYEQPEVREFAGRPPSRRPNATPTGMSVPTSCSPPKLG